MKKKEKELQLLCLQYGRLVSRAHTIFSCTVELILSITIGFFGLVFTFIQVFNIAPDLFKMLFMVELTLIISGAILFVAVYQVSATRYERRLIEAKIKAL